MRTMSMRLQNDMRREFKGFTLVEILVVVVIISIVAAIAIPMLSSASDLQLSSAVNVLMSDLEYAKSMSISRGQVYRVVFDASNDSYEIQDQAGTVIGHPVDAGSDYVVVLGAGSRFDQVSIQSVNFDGGSEVRFDSLGSPLDSSGGSLNNGSVTLLGGGQTEVVKVVSVTGFIKNN